MRLRSQSVFYQLHPSCLNMTACTERLRKGMSFQFDHQLWNELGHGAKLMVQHQVWT